MARYSSDVIVSVGAETLSAQVSRYPTGLGVIAATALSRDHYVHEALLLAESGEDTQAAISSATLHSWPSRHWVRLM